MFGKQKDNNNEFDINSFDNLLHSDMNMEEDDQVDLNDPDLLRQLQELSSSGPEQPKPRPQKKPKPIDRMDIDIDSYHALATGDDDIHVELDESDFSNPQLLNELSTLTHTDEPTQGSRTSPNDTIENNESSGNAEKYNESPEEAEEEANVDPQVWKEKAKSYQKMALEAKKSGDKKRAVELLRESKVYNQKYEENMEIQTAMNVTSKEKERGPLVSPVKREEREIRHSAMLDEPSEVATSEPQSTSELQALFSKAIGLQKEYKEAALYYKKLGNLSAATQMVRTSKELLSTSVKLRNREILDPQSVQLPSRPDMNLGDGKRREVNPVQSASPASQQGIESELLYQINVCHNLTLQSKDPTSKSKTTLDSQPNAYYEAERAFSADLVSLRAQDGQSLPPLHYEQVSYVYKNVNDHIPANAMELKIIRATGLNHLDVAANIEPFVTWDLGGWPPENSANAAMNKGETPTQKGNNPQFDFSLMIPITRTHRGFLRYLQRKKLTIEVFHNKYTYGLFRRPVSLGKVTISMLNLLTKSSIVGPFDLLDASRKKTGGKIDLQVNLREPLTGEDAVKRSERWLVLDAFDSHVSLCLSNAKLTTGGPHMPQASSVVSTVESKKDEIPIDKETPVETKPPASKAIETNEELERAEEELNDVDSIVSNMVLEHELALVNTGSTKEEVVDRKQALELKMNMLVVQVQTGMLDMETYLANVEKRMEQDCRLAILFKKHQRLDLAKAALARKKIMQSELEEARAAMAEE
ncbi:hypothetical protein BY458DRAFT_454646 [Sporodiniella umbellata]|nr:hypothetical protein BY458DRAFT_454646 [Sporodiniella umbellata]